VRLPELEASSEPLGAPEMASAGPERAELAGKFNPLHSYTRWPTRRLVVFWSTCAQISCALCRKQRNSSQPKHTRETRKQDARSAIMHVCS
jgi:hypothetical protein